MLTSIKKLPQDPIFQLLHEFIEDQHENKINLGIGLYSNAEGHPYVFPSIKKAFQEVDTDNFNYQPIAGNREFLNLSADLALDNPDHSYLAMQSTCGGTQACRLFNDLILRHEGKKKILVGLPTWGNHFAVFKDMEPITFDHLNEKGEPNFSAYDQALQEATNKSILLLQGGQTHNPTGKNLSLKQIQKLIPIINEKEIIVFIDCAYLGFGERFEEDRKYLKLCYLNIDNFAFGLSYSKNASLYEHRTGALFIKTKNKEATESQLQQLARESISMSPGLGQEIIVNILKNNKEEWLQEVEEVREDIEHRKNSLLAQLPKEFSYLKNCRGMFGVLQLSPEKIQKLKEEFHIYISGNGRINFAGIRPKKVPYIADSISSL